jgi:hypothetical protein
VFVYSLLSFVPLAKSGPGHELGKDYERANAWLRQHQHLINAKADVHGIPSRMLMAIVFPELVRYNAVYDFMETAALSVLYVTNGDRYADFSIGHFQMKPSFAEMIEEDALIYLDQRTIRKLNMQSRVFKDDEARRRERIKRLESVEGQLEYLIAFYKICEVITYKLSFTNDGDKVRYLATCYNSGYRKNDSEIKRAMKRKTFYTGRFMTSAKFNYGELSREWLNMNGN